MEQLSKSSEVPKGTTTAGIGKMPENAALLDAAALVGMDSIAKGLLTPSATAMGNHHTPLAMDAKSLLLLPKPFKALKTASQLLRITPLDNDDDGTTGTISKTILKANGELMDVRAARSTLANDASAADPKGQTSRDDPVYGFKYGEHLQQAGDRLRGHVSAVPFYSWDHGLC